MREVPSESVRSTDGDMGEAGREIVDAWAAPGALIGGRYLVEGVLGSGGMGCVVRARHRELGELRAIKLLRPERRLAQNAERRLLREARAAARIQSAHVVRIMDVASDGPGAPYIVMEYLEGETLSARLRRGPIGPQLAARIVIEACDALAEAHRVGTVHRDLKPSNLFLVALGNRPDFVKVLDFGIAKTEESDRGDWTQSQALLASPAYASPEQLRASKDADARTDIWSLGVILYQCVTGKLPFEGSTLADVSSRILRDAHVPLRDRAAAATPALALIVDRSLQKSPAARFPHVDALVEALAPLAPEAAAECLARIRTLGPLPLPSAPSKATERSEADGESTLTHPSFEQRAQPSGPDRRQRRGPKWALVAGAAFVLLGGGAFAAWRSQRGSGSAPVMPAPGADSPARNMPAAVPAAAPVAPAAQAATNDVAIAPIAPIAPIASSRQRITSASRDGTRTRAVSRRAPTPPASTSTPATSAGGSEVVPIDRLPLDDLIDGRK